jgi:hypothetical protein
MKPKKLYTVRWTQPYTFTPSTLTDLEIVLNNRIESLIEEGDMTEAQQVIERIMKLK